MRVCETTRFFDRGVFFIDGSTLTKLREINVVVAASIRKCRDVCVCFNYGNSVRVRIRWWVVL